MKTIFTRMVFLLVIVLLLHTPNSADGQQNASPQNKFVQFYIIGMSDITESRAIDQFMRAQPNILISRADLNSRLYFAIFPATANINETTFIAWFTSMGYQISCYREGIHGVDRVLSKENYTCD